MPLELLNLSASQLRELPPTQTVFFFPVAAPEDHGPHLPLGLKLLQARKLSELAATRLEKELPGWKGVLMPDAPMGVDTYTTQTAVRVRAHVLRDWLLDSCRSLVKQGFIHFVCFSGQLTPKQLTTIEEASKMLNPLASWGGFRPPMRLGRNRATLISACSALISPAEVRRSPLRADPPEHGGARDTSLGLDLAPSFVAPNYVTLPAVRKTESTLRRSWAHFRRKLPAYWGAPADASKGEGLKLLQGNLDDIFPKLRAVWEGANPNHLFRSWYSVIPPNKSFFKLWLLALFLLLILWIWAFYVVQGKIF